MIWPRGIVEPGRMKLGSGNAAAAPGGAGALLSLNLDEVTTFPARRATLAAALAKLDELAGGADFVLGHNLIGFDLPHLPAASPQLRLLQLPAVDTLRLNPLAFPRNPYNYLVKHYQDGQLKRGRVNDPDLLASWHWLATAVLDLTGCSLPCGARRGRPQGRPAM